MADRYEWLTGAGRGTPLVPGEYLRQQFGTDSAAVAGGPVDAHPGGTPHRPPPSSSVHRPARCRCTSSAKLVRLLYTNGRYRPDVGRRLPASGVERDGDGGGFAFAAEVVEDATLLGRP